MFFENELTGSLPLMRLVLALLLGLSPVAVTIFVKLMLYGRRIADDVSAPAHQEYKPLTIEGTLEEFAIALANGIANFQDPRRLSHVNAR